jgi:hypothetical protein
MIGKIRENGELGGYGEADGEGEKAVKRMEAV